MGIWREEKTIGGSFAPAMTMTMTMTMSRRSTTFSTPTPLLISLTYTLLLILPYCTAFSAPNNENIPLLFDRFRVSCPADAFSIQQYDSSLSIIGKNEFWAAVYRSNNNLPTVLLKDDFLNSMRIATTETTTSSSASRASSASLIENAPLQQETPVAVARLCPSSEFENKYTLDTMRCWLKKETIDSSCDGGSEHTEALSVAIDALLLHYLSEKTDNNEKKKKDTYTPVFEGTIRTKATLVSGLLLEERGFTPVSELSRDFATHTSSLEDCLEKYASRTISAPMKSNAQAVALQILGKLGLLDEKEEVKAALRLQEEERRGNDDDSASDEEYDPWAGIKKFI